MFVTFRQLPGGGYILGSKRVAEVLISTHCTILVIPRAHFPNQNYYKCRGVLDDDNVSAAIRLLYMQSNTVTVLTSQLKRVFQKYIHVNGVKRLNFPFTRTAS